MYPKNDVWQLLVKVNLAVIGYHYVIMYDFTAGCVPYVSELIEKLDKSYDKDEFFHFDGWQDEVEAIIYKLLKISPLDEALKEKIESLRGAILIA